MQSSFLSGALQQNCSRCSRAFQHAEERDEKAGPCPWEGSPHVQSAATGSKERERENNRGNDDDDVVRAGRGFFYFRSSSSSVSLAALTIPLSTPRQLRPTPNPQPAQQNPLTSGSPLEALKKKTDAAYTWVQDETAEVANTGYRLKTIYYANKTIPRKYLTCE